jgi:hypothetical protein
MMGDMGDDFRAMQARTKEHRANMLAKADTSGWTQHTEYHYSRLFNGERMEWWPSGGKAKFRGKMIYGHAKVNKLIAHLAPEGK